MKTLRFIPARAGNTTATYIGEYVGNGSSPRVRGTPYQYDQAGGVVRFIPARAGNTRESPIQSRHGPVHPRACGEHDEVQDLHALRTGSSPRVRGTHSHRTSPAGDCRFIPARAGNTLRAGRDDINGFGSSPRVRGTPHQERAQRSPHRFIPARAGNTVVVGERHKRRPVHPRACGEHPEGVDIDLWSYGSSPRVRGTQRAGSVELRGGRFIPARAGNTLSVTA